MATQTTVTLIDDIDGSEAAETVEFAIDGAAYEIDLNDKNAKKLRDAVANYVAHGRHVSRANTGVRRRGAKAAATRNSREQLQAIRDWARRQGYEVSDRGRIAANIVEAFEAAH
ncbi:Lsr2 dimerization domain-containing protein [Nakamurella aerolata]|uniref:Lsr2 family protein n=1 Tax=Nakamurella aerolata TaxID=1656892 RepID=A0A849A4J7_9ACTN|nr:Lsr2 family protein [Nakamurella aerolata]